jgi:hypothetical protein
MAAVYDRYQLVKNTDGSVDRLPYVDIPSAPSDKYVQWIEGRSRMDILSQRYYDTPFMDWLILWANPEYISEFDIPDGTTIRIPFPLNRAISVYQDELTKERSK